MLRFIDYFRSIPIKKIPEEETLKEEISKIEDNSKICDICKSKATSYAIGHNGEIFCMKCHNANLES